jgi:2,4-diaminopentanoate dehydrogenase
MATREGGGESLMAYRILQWGTGNVGHHALRAIIERPDFELVGLRVYDRAKVNVDAGELLGREPIGVLATDDPEMIMNLEADCVCYSSLGTTIGGGESVLDDICRLLSSGKNVVSSAVEHHAYFRPGLQFEGAGSNAFERLNDACSAGGTSFFHVGVNPGFAMDLWPMTLSRLCRRIDRLVAIEVVDMADYTSVQIVRDAIGFGLPPGEDSLVDQDNRDVYQSSFYLSMRMLADALGVVLDDVRYRREVAVAEHPFEIATGIIEAGTVAAMKMIFDGIIHGRPMITFELVWRVSADVAPEWPTGKSRWILHVEGDPDLESEIALHTVEDSGRATSLAVATLLLNSVPTVVAAAPGLLDNLTMPPHGGGYFLP